MGGCAAPYCNNSAAKGYTMKVFPRNKERRTVWIKNVGRMNWTPTNNSCLCEVHFATEMWEKRTDKRKLKPNAIPTIFGHFLKKDKQIENNTQVLTENKINIKSTKSNESYQSIDDIQLDQPVDDIQKQKYQVINNASESNELSMISPASCTVQCKEKQEKQYKKFKDIIRKQQLHIVKMQTKMKALRFTIHTLKNKKSNEKHNDKYEKTLRSVFTDHQIKALFMKNRNVRVWSYEAVERALQLKSICGANG